MDWYQKNRKDVDDTYQGQYIAILGERVIAHAETLDDLGGILAASVDNTSVYIVQAGAEDHVAKLRSSNVVR